MRFKKFVTFGISAIAVLTACGNNTEDVNNKTESVSSNNRYNNQPVNNGSTNSFQVDNNEVSDDMMAKHLNQGWDAIQGVIIDDTPIETIIFFSDNTCTLNEYNANWSIVDGYLKITSTGANDFSIVSKPQIKGRLLLFKDAMINGVKSETSVFYSSEVDIVNYGLSEEEIAFVEDNMTKSDIHHINEYGAKSIKLIGDKYLNELPEDKITDNFSLTVDDLVNNGYLEQKPDVEYTITLHEISNSNYTYVEKVTWYEDGTEYSYPEDKMVSQSNSWSWIDE